MKIEGDGNPFVSAKIEIKLDELLTPKVVEALEGVGSAVTVTVSEDTVQRLGLALREHYGRSRTSTPAPEQARIVLDALGVGVREDEVGT